MSTGDGLNFDHHVSPTKMRHFRPSKIQRWRQNLGETLSSLEEKLGQSQGCLELAYHLAVMSGCKDAVTVLLDHGVDVHSGIGPEATALDWAAGHGDGAMVHLLQSRGARFDRSDGPVSSSGLVTAAHEGREDVVSLLLAALPDSHVCQGRCVDALAAAIRAGHETVWKMLLDHGAGRDQGSTLWSSLLAACVRRGDAGMVEYLIGRGADVDVDPTGMDDTPLVELAEAGDREGVEILLRRGARKYVDAALEAAWDPSKVDVIVALLPYSRTSIRTPHLHASHPGFATVATDGKGLGQLPSWTCAICQEEEPSHQEQIVLSMCPHTFHANCFIQWWMKSPTCPFCRQGVGILRGGSQDDAVGEVVTFEP